MLETVSKTPATKWPKFKVRTGCITCKIRRVKCDEAKPSCKRCSDTGRKCDGYQSAEVLNKPRKQHTTTVVISEKQLPVTLFSLGTDARSLSSDLSSGEHQWLQYFSQRAGPALSSLTDKDFWSRMLPQLSLQEPAIRYALLALSSSYANVEAAPRTFGDDSAVGWSSSVRYYNRAISSLHEKFSTCKDSDVAVPLVCCLLFTCLELLYEDRLLMLGHLESGLKILNSLRIRSEDGAFLVTIKHKLQQIFGRLEAQSTFYGNSGATPRVVLLQDIKPAVSKEPFADVIEAKIELDSLTSMKLVFVACIFRGNFSDICPGISPLQYQRWLQERLLSWQLRLQKLQESWTIPDVENVNVATLLHIQSVAGFIYLSNCLERCESSFDAYESHFTHLLEMARLLTPYLNHSSPPYLSSSSSSSTTTASWSSSSSPESWTTNTFSISTPFSFEVSLIAPLYLVALKCRNPELRREAIRMIKSHPGREGLFDPQIHWRVAQRVMEIEEGGIPVSQLGNLVSSNTMSADHASIDHRIMESQGHRRIWVESADIQRDQRIDKRHARVGFDVCVADALVGEERYCWAEDLWF